jgi:hypothetical protein
MDIKEKISKMDADDMRLKLASIILSVNTPEEFYDEIDRLMVDEETGAVNFYLFDIGMQLVKSFYENSKLSDDENDEISDMIRDGVQIN